MTRILQIRRGTTAQNNNFTGLPGELSFDTDTKTMRVHDGATLGGFEMAHRGETGTGVGTGNGGGFDINSVPASFWENIIATYTAPAPTLQHAVSGMSMIANVSYIECIMNVPAPAKFAQCVLVCQTPEAGYAIGDTVTAFGIGTRANPAPNTFMGEDGLHVRLMVAGENFWVSNKSSGTTTQITNAKWRAQFSVLY